MKKQHLPLVTIVILNYNGKQFLKRCVSSVLESYYKNLQVLVVDNNSSDDSIQELTICVSDPRIKILRNKDNFGYAEGNNIGVQYAQGEYVVILNNDTYVERSWLNQAIASMESDHSIGILQCKLMQMDNPTVLDNAGHFIDRLGIAFPIGNAENDGKQYSMAYEIFGATGAAFVIRKDLFVELGGFDKDYFMLFEETDLCWRVRLAGYKILFCPDSVVYHKFAGTMREMSSAWRSFHSCKNRMMSIIKNYQLRNLLKYLPLYIVVLAIYILLNLNKNEQISMAVFKAIMWNLLHFDNTLRKRRQVQNIRKVPDEYFFRNNLIWDINFHRILKTWSWVFEKQKLTNSEREIPTD